MAVSTSLLEPLLHATGPAFPPLNAPPAEHLAWCESFILHCARQTYMAHQLDLPTRKWLRAAELATFAASIWRERAEEAT